MIDPGKFDRQVTIQVKTNSRDSEGGTVAAWADLATLWAEKLPSSGREFRAALAQHATTAQVFRIRYYAGLNETDHRLVYGGQTYDITHVAEDGLRTEYMLVACAYTEGEA
jgi:SPP1 family predicted phage head-tail adaptor